MKGYDSIEVDNTIENPEFPTRIRLIDFDGHLEPAGNYSPPEYDFSVLVEVKYNQVIDGIEKNLVTCTFWTEEDSAQFSFDDDDLDEDSVADWFWEGLSDDLSNHGLESLENLDFYALGVPASENDECGIDLEDFISDALDECVSDIYSDFDYSCTELYKQPVEDIPLTKELEIPCGDCKTVWSIEDYWYERDYDDINDIYISFTIDCSFYVKGERLYSFWFDTDKEYFMEACHNIYSAIVKKIVDSDFDELFNVDESDGMESICDNLDKYLKIRTEDDTLEYRVLSYVEKTLDTPEEVKFALGKLADKWENEYRQKKS